MESPDRSPMAGEQMWLGKGPLDGWERGGRGGVGGMVGVSGIGRRGVVGGGGGADGLSRALEMDDLQQANRNRHGTRFAKLLLLMAHVRCSRVAKVGRWAPCHTRTAEGGGEEQQKGISGGRRESRCGGPFCRKGGTGMSGAMAKKRKKNRTSSVPAMSCR